MIAITGLFHMNTRFVFARVGGLVAQALDLMR
jgi:hypothetical protein